MNITDAIKSTPTGKLHIDTISNVSLSVNRFDNNYKVGRTMEEHRLDLIVSTTYNSHIDDGYSAQEYARKRLVSYLYEELLRDACHIKQHILDGDKYSALESVNSLLVKMGCQ